MTWLGTDFLRLTGSRRTIECCQKLAGNGAQILTMSAMSNAAAYNNGVMVRASGIPITMAAKTHTAESRHVARPLRRCASKKLSRSRGPMSGAAVVLALIEGSRLSAFLRSASAPCIGAGRFELGIGALSQRRLNVFYLRRRNA